MTAPKHISIALLLALASPALAQATDPAPEKPKDPPASEPAETPSLDDLLGLPSTKLEPKPGEDAPASAPKSDLTEERLDEALDSEEAIKDQFKLALKEMGETADRLEFSLDTGATTQRLQQSIIKRLEDLIEASQQQQQQQQQSQQQSQSQQQQQPNQPQQQSQSQSDNPQGENRDERLPLGGPQDAELRDTLDAARAAWGALPERVREALQQGSEDFYSRVYNSLTESYYKRLAEEGTER